MWLKTLMGLRIFLKNINQEEKKKPSLIFLKENEKLRIERVNNSNDEELILS
jgi:hypothetical protein